MINDVYNYFVRPHLPSKIGVYNGVAVRNRVKLFDIDDEFSEYEEALVASLRNNVQTGNKVCIVGGGLGVTSVVAANQVGTSGHVRVYEASEQQVNIVEDTIKLNQVENRVEVKHAIVGSYFEESIERYGETGHSTQIPPSELPECDLLELDCEGAELEILDQMEIQPRKLIIETHGFLNAETDNVIDIIENRGYNIESNVPYLAEKGIDVVTATLEK